MPFNSLILCHPLCFCLQSFPVSWLFTSGGQSVEASASVLPMNIQGWFPFELIGLITLLSKGLLRAFSSSIVQKHEFFSTLPSLWSNCHTLCMTAGKTRALTTWNFVSYSVWILSLQHSAQCLFHLTFFERCFECFYQQEYSSLSCWLPSKIATPTQGVTK